MDNRFANLFDLTEAEAIALLDTPQEQLEAGDSQRYIAASHLANFPSEQSIEALTRAVNTIHPSLENRIARRKSIESLGRLRATQALPAIAPCLADEDCYTVETAVWAIGEIGTQDETILNAITQLLEKPGQIYRIIIQTLARLNYQPAVEHIRNFIESSDAPTASAAIVAVGRLTGDYGEIDRVVKLLLHPNINARRSCLQDLIDARYYAAIPNIARCPVSMAFRLRAIRLMAEEAVPAGNLTFEAIQPSLELALLDRPRNLDLVHEYDQLPSLEFLVQDLYQTDFGRCYLATKLLLECYPQEAPQALLATYEKEAHNDYGAHYHVMKLLGWLQYAPAYELLVEALHNDAPQFEKSRAAAAIALAEIGDSRAIPELQKAFDTKIWTLKYAALIALEKLGDTSGRDRAATDPDWLIRARAAQA